MTLLTVDTSTDRVAALAVLVVLATAVGPAAASGVGGEADPERVAVVVGFHGEPDPELVRQLGGNVTDTFDIIPAVAATVPVSAVATLERRSEVAYVDADARVELNASGRRVGGAQEQTVPWGVTATNATDVQSNGTTGNGVIVAVLDTGIDADHPDLEDSYIGGVDVVNGDDVPDDENGHGTFVAGTIAAADDDHGVVGVAPEASIYAVKVLNETADGTLSDVVAGIEWAIAGPDGVVGTDDDADVISMSIGTFVGSVAMGDAVEAAYRDHGVVVVGAAGNAGERDFHDTVKFPARFPEAIAVGAVDREGGHPPWSGEGPPLELVAPGVDVLSTYRGGTQAVGSGTSAATPYVAGVVALVMASRVPSEADADEDGEWDAPEVRSRLRATARDLGPPGRDREFGHGRVDAAAAVGPPRPNEPPNVSIRTPEAGPVSGNVTVRVAATDREDVDATLDVVVAVDGRRVGPATYNATDGVFVRRLNATTFSEDGRHRVTATVTDDDGASASDAVVLTRDARDDPPTVAIEAPANGSTVSGYTTVRASASDDRTTPADLEVAFRVAGNRWVPMEHVHGDTYQAASVLSLPPGEYVLRVRATDGANNTTTTTVVVVVERDGGNTTAVASPGTTNALVPGATDAVPSETRRTAPSSRGSYQPPERFWPAAHNERPWETAMAP